ncbi:NAD(+) synthetase, partial [bacterium]|nr:NAD(+) synthetase [bacterium]
MHEQWDQVIERALNLNVDLTRTLLVDFIRTEIRRTGMSKAVIGLSGGIDSALSAYLTAEALGAENLLCVIMPHKVSNPASKEDALKVVDDLGCRHK